MPKNSKKSSVKQKTTAATISGAKKTAILTKILVVLIIVFAATVIGTYIVDRTTTSKLKAKAGSVNVKQIWEAGDGDGDGKIMKIVACMRGDKIVVIFGKDTEYMLWSGVAPHDKSVDFDRNQQWWGGEVQAREINSTEKVVAALYSPSQAKYVAIAPIYRVGLPNC